MPPTDPTGPWPEQQVLLTRLAAWMSERRWFPLKDEQPPDGAALRVVADSRTAYEDFSPPRPSPLDAPAAIIRPRGAGRPTKKERRQLDALMGGGRHPDRSSG